MDNKLKEEIEKLEEELNNIKKENIKRNIVKNLKISKTFLRGVAPYALTTCIIAGTLKLTGVGFPFYTDTVKRTADIKNEFDANGSLIKSEKLYGNYEEEYENRINRLLLYSNWTKNKDNKYERTIKSYKLKKKDLTYITHLDDVESFNITDILGKPYMEQIETREYLPEEEQNTKPYIEIIIYNKDKNDYIMIKEEISENIGKTALFVALTSVSYLLILLYRDNLSNFNYNEEIKKIKFLNSKEDTKEIKEELKKKKKELRKKDALK